MTYPKWPPGSHSTYFSKSWNFREKKWTDKDKAISSFEDEKNQNPEFQVFSMLHANDNGDNVAR